MRKKDLQTVRIQKGGENLKSDWTVVSYKHKSTGQQGRRGKPYDKRQFGYKHNTPRGGFMSRGKKSSYVMSLINGKVGIEVLCNVHISL